MNKDIIVGEVHKPICRIIDDKGNIVPKYKLKKINKKVAKYLEEVRLTAKAKIK